MAIGVTLCTRASLPPIIRSLIFRAAHFRASDIGTTNFRTTLVRTRITHGTAILKASSFSSIFGSSLATNFRAGRRRTRRCRTRSRFLRLPVTLSDIGTRTAIGRFLLGGLLLDGFLLDRLLLDRLRNGRFLLGRLLLDRFLFNRFCLGNRSGGLRSRTTGKRAFQQFMRLAVGIDRAELVRHFNLVFFEKINQHLAVLIILLCQLENPILRFRRFRHSSTPLVSECIVVRSIVRARRKSTRQRRF